MRRLKEETYKAIQYDSDLQAKIVLFAKISFPTISLWIKKKETRLNEYGILKIICKHLNKNNVEELFANEENNIVETEKL